VALAPSPQSRECLPFVNLHRDGKLYLVIVALECDLNCVQMYLRAKHLGQISFRLKRIVQIDTHSPPIALLGAQNRRR